MSEYLIEAKNIHLNIAGQAILKDISLQVPRGHFMGIVGPNGAGKSSLIAILTGRYRPQQGSLRLFGVNISRYNHRQQLRRIGYLHQLNNTPAHVPMKVKNVVAMGLPQWNRPLWSRIHPQREIERALQQVDMDKHSEKDFRSLSGGQAQRVRLARALVNQPDLLLLDEPSAAMDSSHQQQLYILLRRLCNEQGMSVVMVEHDIAAITAHVDSVACLNQRIHYHALKGEQIPEDIWHSMYGSHMHVIAHDSSCIGCQ